jgi:two-component system sensor histidine kinase VicK
MEEEKKLKFLSNILSEKIFLILFIFLIISLIVITSLNLFFSEESLKEISFDKLSEKVGYQKKEIDSILDNIQSDLSSIPNYDSVRGIVNSMRNGGINSETGLIFQYYLNQLNVDFIDLMKLNNSYYKICYVDKEGNEIVRLEYEDEGIKRIPDKDLENISSEVFFNETINFEKGKIYVSDIFLKKEKDSSKIIIPYTPMIRYAIPVFNKINGAVGIVSIDVSANIFLKNLNEVFVEENEFKYQESENFLINEDGFYYHNPNKEKEWGNFDNLNTGENFKRDFSENIFSFIFSKSSGVLESKELELVFAYNSIFPNETNKEQFWVLLESVPRNVILSPILNYRNYVFLSLLFLSILSVVFSFVITIIILKPIRNLNKELKIVKQGKIDYQILSKPRGEIGRLAKMLNDILIFFRKNIFNIEKKLNKELEYREKRERELEDEQIAILNVLEDVKNERDKVEEMARELIKFQLAVENVSDLITITDDEGKIIYTNRAIKKITGFRKKDVLGKKAGSRELWGGLMSKEFYQKMWKTILDKKPFIGEFKNKRKNGEEYYAIVNIVSVLNRKNEIIFFVAVERDITEQRSIDRAKSEFVSLASHQLRTPLSTIKWYAEMLIGEDIGKLKKEQKQYVEEIERGNTRMIELVNALLNVSTLELGTFIIESESLDIREISDKVIEELGQILKKKKHEFIKTYGKNIPKILLDRKLISVILENVLSNAIKYTPEKGKIELKILKEKRNIKIVVSDNGIGIPKKQQKRVFEKLFRADNVKITDTDGTGLGLYIVKSILDQSGGKIWFKSEENVGSTFYITIPLKGMKSKKGIRKIA